MYYTCLVNNLKQLLSFFKNDFRSSLLVFASVCGKGLKLLIRFHIHFLNF